MYTHDMSANFTQSKEELKKILEHETYRVTQEKGTEAPFTGKYDHHFEDGKYQCVVCGAELFTSETKYDSGCGWPAFFGPAAADSVKYTNDFSHGMQRVEITCAKCGSHLGHVFPDGPIDRGGQRYCVNSVSLEFKKE